MARSRRKPSEVPGDDAGTAPNPESWLPFLAGLRAFVARRIPSQDVEDVSQEILLRIHRGFGRLRAGDRAEAWIYAVARRAIADFYRYRGPAEAPFEETAAEAESPQASPRGFASFAGDHSAHEEVLTWLRPLAEELPETYREALLEVDFGGATQQELADRLGLSLSGAKSRVQRGRKLLAENLRRCCEVEMGSDGRVSDFRRNQCDC